MTRARQAQPGEGHIRPLDPFRDLDSVVDLISLAFGDRLDPAGQATLDRMRRFAQSGPLLQWVWALMGRASVAPGLVWVVDGRVVGNVSVRRARSPGGVLIGNVVVHPDHRGQGIATALMRRAIKAVDRRGAHWVGLEVRNDNEVARGLYERFGFREMGRTHHLLLTSRSVEPGPSYRSDRMRPAGRRDGDALVRLVKDLIPEEHRPLLEIREADYRPGWGRRIDHWLRCEDEIWWITEGDDGIRGGVRAVHKRGAFPDRMEVLVRPGAGAHVGVALVRRGVARLRGLSGKPIEASLPESMGFLMAVLEEEGFEKLRVLIQMRRRLGHRISLPSKR